MKIYLATVEIFYSEEAAYRHYRLNTQRAVSIDNLDWSAEGYADFREPGSTAPDYNLPVIPAGYRKTDVRVPMEGYWTWQVVAKTAEELSVERAQAVEQIKHAGKAYLYERIDSDGIALVERLVAAGHPYGLKNSQWCIDLRKDQYLRMAQVEAGVIDFSPELLDFSGHGDKPYTVVQMMMAAGL